MAFLWGLIIYLITHTCTVAFTINLSFYQNEEKGEQDHSYLVKYFKRIVISLIVFLLATILAFAIEYFQLYRTGVIVGISAGLILGSIHYFVMHDKMWTDACAKRILSEAAKNIRNKYSSETMYDKEEQEKEYESYNTQYCSDCEDIYEGYNDIDEDVDEDLEDFEDDDFDREEEFYGCYKELGNYPIIELMPIDEIPKEIQDITVKVGGTYTNYNKRHGKIYIADTDNYNKEEFNAALQKGIVMALKAKGINTDKNLNDIVKYATREQLPYGLQLDENGEPSMIGKHSVHVNIDYFKRINNIIPGVYLTSLEETIALFDTTDNNAASWTSDWLQESYLERVKLYNLGQLPLSDIKYIVTPLLFGLQHRYAGSKIDYDKAEDILLASLKSDKINTAISSQIDIMLGVTFAFKGNMIKASYHLLKGLKMSNIKPSFVLTEFTQYILAKLYTLDAPLLSLDGKGSSSDDPMGFNLSDSGVLQPIFAPIVFSDSIGKNGDIPAYYIINVRTLNSIGFLDRLGSYAVQGNSHVLADLYETYIISKDYYLYRAKFFFNGYVPKVGDRMINYAEGFISASLLKEEKNNAEN